MSTCQFNKIAKPIKELNLRFQDKWSVSAFEKVKWNHQFNVLKLGIVFFKTYFVSDEKSIYEIIKYGQNIIHIVNYIRVSAKAM